MIFDFKNERLELGNSFSLGRWLGLCGSRYANLYVIMCYRKGEHFIKVGRTCSSISKRFRDLPYYYTILYSEHISPRKAFHKEEELHKTLKTFKYGYKPQLKFVGQNECYIMESLDLISEIIGSMIKKPKYKGRFVKS
jgi:hypothetical protein